MTAGVDSWVIDTGSGHNLVPRTDLNAEELQAIRPASEPLRLSTANGVIKVRDVTDCRISEFGQVLESRVLDKTLRVLSVQQLVEKQGAAFSWTPEGAKLVMHGKTHYLLVKQGVPLLALAALEPQ